MYLEEYFMVNLFFSVQKFQALPSQSTDEILDEVEHREPLELRRKSGCLLCRLRFGVVSIPCSIEATSRISSLSLCQGFLILSSHLVTHGYFSFQRTFPTILSCFVSPVSVTCTWDGGFLAAVLKVYFSAERLNQSFKALLSLGHVFKHLNST